MTGFFKNSFVEDGYKAYIYGGRGRRKERRSTKVIDSSLEPYPHFTQSQKADWLAGLEKAKAERQYFKDIGIWNTGKKDYACEYKELLEKGKIEEKNMLEF